MDALDGVQSVNRQSGLAIERHIVRHHDGEVCRSSLERMRWQSERRIARAAGVWEMQLVAQVREWSGKVAAREDVVYTSRDAFAP